MEDDKKIVDVEKKDIRKVHGKNVKNSKKISLLVKSGVLPIAYEMNYTVRLGYACLNNYLRAKDIFCGRTVRIETFKKFGLGLVNDLVMKNLTDLLKILEWNEAHNIKLHRMSSEMFPHLSNHEFIPSRYYNDPTRLAYSLAPFRKMLVAIGEYANSHGHRLTFHPPQFVNLGSPDQHIINNSARILYMHALIMDEMKLPLDSIMIVHGGGVYENKLETIKRWARNFNKLPLCIKRRLVIENDEKCYSIDDVLVLSRALPKFKGSGDKYKIPIVFDIFHYECYKINIDNNTPCAGGIVYPAPIETYLPAIIQSWGNRTVKMHISEQGRGPLGKHSFTIHELPKWVLTFPKKYKRMLDLMLEAKGKEINVINLRKLYGL